MRSPAVVVLLALTVLLSIGAGLRTGDGEGAAYTLGAVAGSVLAALLIAAVLRWLYLRARRAPRETPIVSTGWAATALVVALVRAVATLPTS